MNTQTLEYKDARIILGEMTDDAAVMCSQLGNLEAYRAEFECLKHEKRQKEFLSVRIALNSMLGEEVLITYDEHRKPGIAGHNMHISISHSGPYFALMLHPRSEVGIDLECRTRRVQNVYQRYLSAEEQKWFFHEEDTRALEITWSAKEALYKIIGRKALDFAGSLTVHPFIPDDAGTLTATHLQESTTKDFQLYYIINAAYTLAACIDHSNFEK